MKIILWLLHQEKVSAAFADLKYYEPGLKTKRQLIQAQKTNTIRHLTLCYTWVLKLKLDLNIYWFSTLSSLVTAISYSKTVFPYFQQKSLLK